ncbi:hypothetical protein ACT009_11565 [Sphingomonas sp. Tas61C01]|uniref:hypothetical protein n=1 Tax=Sphingomonas sp. Tas61C01 TaxID=3458297 RepID=UPI00403E81D7
MLNTLGNATKLRRQAIALVDLQDKAATARRVADLIETAADTACATARDLAAGQQPAVAPTELLTWLAKRVPAAKVAVDVPVGTDATGRARLTLAAVSRAATAATARADRLELTVHREEERFLRVSLRILQADPVLSGAFTAAATAAGITFSTDNFGQTADRFCVWLAEGKIL